MKPITEKPWLLIALATLLALLLVRNVASAQTPPPGKSDIVLSGFLTCPIGNGESTGCPSRLHYVDLTQGRTYLLRMDSSKFHSRLTLEDMHGNLLAADTDYFDSLDRTIVFRAPATGTYRLIATSSPPTSEGFYTIDLREIPVMFRIEASLTPRDPVANGCFHKTHEVTLVAGRRYIIDVESNHFNAFLKLQDGGGAIVAFDDEGCGERPARVVYTPLQTGNFRLVATSVSPFATGAFTLTVCED
jgi:hypothetical protein